MSMTEALLRPSVELYSAATSAAIGSIAFTMPWVFQVSPVMGAAIGTSAFGFAYWRGRQGLLILRYTMGLKKYKITSIAPHKIPDSRERLYLGDGFAWTQKHTQRLMDARSAAGQQFLDSDGLIGKLTGKALRAMLKQVRRAAVSAAFVNALTTPRWWNPLSDIPDLGGTPLIHAIEPDEIPVTLGQKHRSGHMLVIGTTRVGKTRLMELLVTQDIRDKKVTIILDPKGDRDLMLRVYAEAARAGRLDQLYLFHLGFPEISARYNGIGNFARVTEIANRTTNALPAEGNSAAFKEFSWRFTNLVAQAQVALGTVPTYQGILADITNIEPLFVRYARHALTESGVPDWKARVDRAVAEIESKKPSFPIEKSLMGRDPEVIALIHVANTARVPGETVDGVPNPVLQGMCTAVRYDRTFFEKIIASLGPFLEKLITGDVGKMISPDYFDPKDRRPVFDWMQVIRQGGIVYVGLDALSDPVVSSAVGNSMLADLVSVGGKIYKFGIDPHNPKGDIVMADVSLHADEVNELMGPEFIPMVNKLGGSGFKVHAYTQTIPDIEARLGSVAKAQQVLGNFNHVVMLRVKLPETAEFFCRQLPQAEVTTLTAVSGVSDTAGDQDSTHFTSNNQDRAATQMVDMITPADIMVLPQGQAFALLEGNRLYKIRMPMPTSASNDPCVPASLREIGEKMRMRYERGADNWASMANVDWRDVVLGQPIGAEGYVSEPAEVVA